MKQVKKKENERGIVLIIVLIVIAILTIVVADFTFSTHVDLEISNNTLNDIKAQYIAKSGISVVSSVMKSNNLEDLGDISSVAGDGEVEVGSGEESLWSLNVPAFAVGDGVVTMTVEDERSKINLNSLINQTTNKVDFQVLAALTELFRYLEVDAGKSELFTASLINWLDRSIKGAQNDQDPRGAQGNFYNTLENPYTIKDGPMDSLEEIRMIEGMDEDFYNKIVNYVTVYPVNKQVNFSTASKPVMIAILKAAQVSAIQGENRSDTELKDDVAEAIADEIIEKRQDDKLISRIEVRDISRDIDSNLRISAGLSGLLLNQGTSETFSIKASGVVGEVNPTIKDIEAVVRKGSGRNAKTEILSWKER